MTYIILVGGIKGGVGKTLVCRTCIEYLESTGKSVIAVDSDREVQDVSGLYESESIGFSDDLRRAMEPDRILEMAEQKPDYIVVNLPGNTYQPLQEWLITTGSIQTRKAPEGQPQFVQFFITDGCWSSIQLLQKSLSDHNDNLPHVLIRNSGRLMSSPDWSYLDSVPEYREMFEKHCILVADFPLVATPVLFELDRKTLTFRQAIDTANSLLARRARFFVNQYNQTFDQIFEQLPNLVEGKLKVPKKSQKKVTLDDLANQLKKDILSIEKAIANTKNLKELAAKLNVSEETLNLSNEQYQKLRDKIPAESGSKSN
ncbi:MAG: hypothetical protein F6K54_05440 [Okeania sp. SIO3B5]|uniref:nucleotide-binding protein n=1 Tax=Okeania sp. SIO3B5 TaxID=2607811 RepID=UPI0013FF5CCB|nr:hypothetical protein [Okeania sp. SIO3B5]NEO52562.1 hypothetical protein [Okeania sp. SIO3B5]